MTTLVDAPTRVDGVQLLGEMVGSGYRRPPALVRRSDGQVLQLTPLLYLVLAATDGRRTAAEIAEVVGSRLGRLVSESDVRTLVDGHLRPLGLVRCADGTEPEVKRSNPLLRLKPRIAVTSPESTRRLTDPFRRLFHPLVWAAVTLGFAAIVAWVFFDRGLGPSAYDAFERPHLLLLVFVVTVLSGGFHEFGHAAAARYGGAQPGAMGAGLYIVWPAFYTDVTDSYRLGRGGRIRTDLGGLYFNAIVVVLTFVWWWATGWEALLLLVATQVFQMAQQLLPLLRFDGYHLLADLAGVPDLYQRIRPTLLGLLPWRWKMPENRVLTPVARVLITLWVLITVPMMTLMLLSLVAAVPRLLGTAGSAVRTDAQAVADAWAAGDVLDVVAQSLQVLAVVLPVLAGAVVLFRVGTRWFGGLARWSRGSRPKRLVAAVLSTLLVTGLSWAWWPHPGNYRPLHPGDTDLVAALSAPEPAPTDGLFRPATGILPSSGASTSRRSGRLAEGGPLAAAFQKDQALPTKKDPRLALVLVPRDSEGGSDGASSEPWVFPFDKPLLPAEGDNQALAINQTDNSAVYDVALALVWAEGDEVLNINEAHAYASCSDCVAVAVAFQVVLVMDNAHVVIPQNLAVAANYDCYRCITAAIANQLVLSVEDEPGEEQLRALSEVWSRLLVFAKSLTAYSLSEITAQLESFKAEIVEIIDKTPVVESEASAKATAEPTPGQDAEDTEQEGAAEEEPSGSQTTESTPAPASPSPTAPASPAPSTAGSGDGSAGAADTTQPSSGASP